MGILLRAALLIAVVVAAVAPSAPAPAQQLPIRGLDLLDQLGGVVSRPSVVGDVAHVVVGSRHHVLGVGSPTRPEPIVESDAGELVLGRSALRGRYLYVAAGARGLRIYDVADPLRLVEVAAVALGGVSSYVVLEGDRAYVAGTGLHVVDVSDPPNAVKLGEHLQAGSGPIALAGNYLFEVSGTSVEVWYVPFARDITRVATVNYSTSGTAAQAILNGSTLYVADHFLRAFDVADPTRPVEVGRVDLPAAPTDLVVENGYAYVSEMRSRTATGGLRTLDVRDPAAPALVGTLLGGRNLAALTRVGAARLLVNEDLGGLRVVDFSTPSAPVEVGAYDTVGIADDVVLADGRAYVVELGLDGGTFYRVTTPVAIVDASDPGDLRLLGRYVGRPRGTIAARSGYIYVGEAPDRTLDTLRSVGGVRIVDARDPTQPAEVGFIEFPGDFNTATWPLSLAVVGGYLYVLEGDASQRTGGLRVYSLANPAAPSFVTVVTTPVTGIDNRMFLGDGFLVLKDRRVFSTANPAGPVEVGSLPADGSSTSVAAGGRRAYVGGSSPVGFGLTVQTRIDEYDMTDPAAPVKLGTYPERTAPRNAVGDRLVTGGLRVWANPSCPTVVASYPYGGPTWVDADRLLVAAGSAGLHALRVTATTGQCLRVLLPLVPDDTGG
jgi:hypothetical protein